MLPFQYSISVCPALLLLWKPPTAQMSLAERTVIPSRKLLVDPAWLGLLTTLHALPFQCSIRVCPIWAKDWPTAQMLLLETTAIPIRREIGAGLGLLTTLH